MIQEKPFISETSPLGKSISRIDALDKVLGRAKFTADLCSQFPGLLHARVLRSPHAHARILTLDVSRAEKFPGVKGVVTDYGSNCRAMHCLVHGTG